MTDQLWAAAVLIGAPAAGVALSMLSTIRRGPR